MLNILDVLFFYLSILTGFTCQLGIPTETELNLFPSYALVGIRHLIT